MKTPPICSIILVSYKNFRETTGPCLASLRHCPDNIEIIVVDNDSGIETLSQLRHCAEADSRIRLLAQKKNYGYAAANNIGAKTASADLLLLLNSDTRVPPDAVQKLCAILKNNSQWDMLGPVTNSCGNDQQIYCAAADAADILAEGVDWCKNAAKISFQTDRLIFFCVLIRSSLYKELQGLDEDFGLGYFEDTDFVYRARAAGKKLAITEEVFVYHQGRGSFSKVSGAVQKLMKQNRKLFRRKHGHGEITDHWRIKNLQALQRYKDHLHGHMPFTLLLFSFANRQQLAETLLPNNPVKRFFYLRKLRAVKRSFKTKLLKII